MKKIAITAASLAFLSLAACGGGTADSANSTIGDNVAVGAENMSTDMGNMATDSGNMMGNTAGNMMDAGNATMGGNLSDMNVSTNAAAENVVTTTTSTTTNAQ